MHCPTQRACACMGQHLCMNRKKPGLDFAPSEFTGANTFLWWKTDSHHTYTIDCGVQLLCSSKKKTKIHLPFPVYLCALSHRAWREAWITVYQQMHKIITPLSINIFSPGQKMPMEVLIPACLKPSLTVLGFSKGPITLVSKYKQWKHNSQIIWTILKPILLSVLYRMNIFLQSPQKKVFKTYETSTVQKDCCFPHTKGGEFMYQWPISKSKT